ncbi:FRIGIDA-like protein 3 [Argentina anserina]|uniref:FRIGIDA-like protein 3 n=1 Tax=Argentina anserina TaxID=57926 RepID=UPI00217667E9|nr:FRIGIDA-like protein 3 [Potentilla anserina]
MEESVRSTRNTVQVRCQELEDRERQVADHQRKMDVLKAEAGKRAVELRGLEKLIQERRKEAVKEERHLDSLKVSIKEKKEELENKEKRLSDAERMIGLKEGLCESIQKRMKEGLAKVSRVQKEIEEKTELKEKLHKTVEVKGKVLCSHRRSVEEWSRKLEAKGRQLEELSGKIELKEKQLEPRVEIQLIEKRVNECLNEIELKERHLHSIERSIHEREESMKEWSSKLEAKGKELEELSEKIEMKEKQFDEPRMNEIELKERYLQSFEKSIQGREKSLEEHQKRLNLISDGIVMREKELDRKAKEHQLKQYEPAPVNYVISSLVKVGEPESFPAKQAAVSSSSNLQVSDSLDARNFQGCGSGNDVPGNHCFTNLQSSLDPGKLVLDWMQTYLSQYWTKADVGFELTSIKTYISLLEQLMRLSSHANAQLKEGVMKLAVQWKSNMRADTRNYLEILGFLHFITTFRLLYTLNVDEIVRLLQMISQHKEALELCPTIGFADKIPEFIRILVERKQLMEAVRIVDDQITRLRSTINMIKEHNLDSEYASTNIEMQITKLHHVKENWRLQLGNSQTVPKRGTKRSSDTHPTKIEPSLKQPNKLHRTVVAAPTLLAVTHRDLFTR